MSPQNLTPYPNAPALSIQYTGSGTAATLSISGNVLSTVVTGATGDNLSVDLTLYNTRQGLHDYLASVAHYSITDPSSPLARPNTRTINLLNVSNQNIKTAPFALLYDQTKLVPDEMTKSKSTIETNVAGSSESFFVYPDGIEDLTTEVDAVAAGYTAARGSLAMKDQNNSAPPRYSRYAAALHVDYPL